MSSGEFRDVGFPSIGWIFGSENRSVKNVIKNYCLWFFGLCCLIGIVLWWVFTPFSAGDSIFFFSQSNKRDIDLPACLSSILPAYTIGINSKPTYKPAIESVASQPIAQWYTDRPGNFETRAAKQFLPRCSPSEGSDGTFDNKPVIVIYGLPGKDCENGSDSSGENKNSDNYQQFLQHLVNRAQSRPVLYIVEPDALELIINGGCALQNSYDVNLAIAINLLGSNPNAEIYVDVGYWLLETNVNATKVANLIDLVDKNKQCKGIALNVANYRSTIEMTGACKRFSAISKRSLHCVIDTSRNYLGAPSTEWCNTNSTGIGVLPTSSTGNKLIDYFIWVKPPGLSDGSCKGKSKDAMIGPDPGVFFPDHFKELWNNGVFVQDLQKSPLQ